MDRKTAIRKINEALAAFKREQSPQARAVIKQQITETIRAYKQSQRTTLAKNSDYLPEK